MPGESPCECLSNTVAFSWLPPTKISPQPFSTSLYRNGDQQYLLLELSSYWQNQQSSDVMSWYGKSSPRKMTSHSILASRLNDRFIRRWPKSNGWPQPSLLTKVTFPNISPEKTHFSASAPQIVSYFWTLTVSRPVPFSWNNHFSSLYSSKFYPNARPLPWNPSPQNCNILVSSPLLNSQLNSHGISLSNYFSTVHLNGYCCVLLLCTFSGVRC